MKIPFFIITIFATIIISLFVFYPSFSLALFGDDWLAFFRFLKYLGPKSSGDFNYLSYFLTCYGPSDMAMGILYKIYDFQSHLYYLTSYFLRILASLSLYPLTLYLTKNKLSALFAVLFFSITTTGLETTVWVFNMPSYLLIAFFNLFLYFFLQLQEKWQLKGVILSGFFFYLAFIMQPIRAHGFIPFVILTEIYYLLQRRKLNLLIPSFIRISGVILIFIFIYFAGLNRSPNGVPLGSFSIGLNSIFNLLQQGRSDFIFYPLATIGSMLVPQTIIQNYQIVSIGQLIFKIFLPVYLLYIFIVIFLADKIKGFNKHSLFAAIGSGLIWNIVVLLIYQLNIKTFSDNSYITSLLIGGYFLIIWLILLLKTEPIFRKSLFIAFSWTISSFFFAWWQFPHTIFLTTHRYLIVSAIGISLFFATIISLGKTSKNTKSLFIFCSLFLLIQLFSTRSYLNKQNDTHNQQVSNKIWSSMPNIPEMGKDELPLIFYFEGDGTNEGIIQDSITFGFPPHMALLYNINAENRTPIPVSNWQEVISAVKDGKVLPAYGYPAKPVSPERIFAFKLIRKDNLINVTDFAREKLAEEIIK